jgi:hypothetical protein
MCQLKLLLSLNDLPSRGESAAAESHRGGAASGLDAPQSGGLLLRKRRNGPC